MLGGWWEDGWCVECGCVIHDHDKPWMLARGVWVVGERGRVEKAANGAKAANAANAAEAANEEGESARVAGITLPDGSTPEVLTVEQPYNEFGEIDHTKVTFR